MSWSPDEELVILTTGQYTKPDFIPVYNTYINTIYIWWWSLVVEKFSDIFECSQMKHFSIQHATQPDISSKVFFLFRPGNDYYDDQGL